MSPLSPFFSPRYVPVRRLGHGGGGEVWAVRDVLDNTELALKTLHKDASELEMQALVREASLLSGLEGLGVPRVHRFGRIPATGAPFLLRDLVPGQSLEERLSLGLSLEEGAQIVMLVADQLTRLHRASLLHGDIKPANVIVSEQGGASLVDLGLAIPWRRDKGHRALGFTPRYAAPELFEGGPLAVRTEVYSLGATLRDVLERATTSASRSPLAQALTSVVQRATREQAQERFPSVDELSLELRRALGMPPPKLAGLADSAWPTLGLETWVAPLLEELRRLQAGDTLAIVGAPGSGRSTVLRNLSWSLGVDSPPIALVAGRSPALTRALSLELSALKGSFPQPFVLVDDADQLSAAQLEELEQARRSGARLVLVTPPGWSAVALSGAQERALPPLDQEHALTLIQRAMPSLSPALTREIVARSGGIVGSLRDLLRQLEGAAIVSRADIDAALGEPSVRDVKLRPRLSGIEQVMALLDQGRSLEAGATLERFSLDKRPLAEIARGRLMLAQGKLDDLMKLAQRTLDASQAMTPQERAWTLVLLGRVHLRKGHYGQAISVAEDIQRWLSKEPHSPEEAALLADTLSFQAVAESLLGESSQAFAHLERARRLAYEASSARTQALAMSSLAFVQQRSERLEEARRSYEEALLKAEEASDASLVATVHMNLAALSRQAEASVAHALRHLEAAIDMGLRAGAVSTVRNAQLNLANLDLYLGRVARAGAIIEGLQTRLDQLDGPQRAQLLGLRAELAAHQEHDKEAVKLYDECATAYRQLGREDDAAESQLEGILLAVRKEGASLEGLDARLDALEERASHAHRVALALARGAIALARDQEESAAKHMECALALATEQQQREWCWRAQEALARLEAQRGKAVAAQRALEAALSILEQLASQLPRDLREVFWNDPRRRAVRDALQAESRPLMAPLGLAMPSPSRQESRSRALAISTAFAAPDSEVRLASLLQINRQIAAARNLSEVLQLVIQNAVTLARAEKGYVLLLGQDGTLSVHAMGARADKSEEPARAFSRSIATKVLSSGESFVSLGASDDSRINANLSVLALALQSVACVPIRAPEGTTLGAIYVETSTRRGTLFEAELPTLQAFAEQAAIAIESARLHARDAAQRAQLEEVNLALAHANEELRVAHDRLEQALSRKVAQLEETKRSLRTARAALAPKTAFHGIIGASDPMRRIFEVIERVAKTDVSVLVTGESGTGKELVARAVHLQSSRADKTFLGINCGALPQGLLEGELFGHVRGAFSGADRDRKGLLREAEGGTALLDEIGEMPLKMQASLLRVLQERTVRPLGGDREEPIDVRVIAATHRSLPEMVVQQTFREDLYYRLRVVEIVVPPLRERHEDIPLLVDHFLDRFAVRYRRPRASLSRAALQQLTQHPWPGNIRQLEHVLLNAWLLADRDTLETDDFELPSPHPITSRPTPDTGAAPKRTSPGSLKGSQEELERAGFLRRLRFPQDRDRVIEALKKSNWNRVRAADALGIPLRTFYRHLKKLGIE